MGGGQTEGPSASFSCMRACLACPCRPAPRTSQGGLGLRTCYASSLSPWPVALSSSLPTDHSGHVTALWRHHRFLSDVGTTLWDRCDVR